LIPESLLNGDNAAFLDALYASWLEDPNSVEPEYRGLFDGFGQPGAARPAHGRLPGTGPTIVARSIFAGGAGPDAGHATSDERRRQARVVQLVNAYRVRGHLDAAIDPLDRRERVAHPELTLHHWGLTDADLDSEVDTSPAFGMPPRGTVREVLEHLRKAYCGSVGAEFMNVIDTPQRRWVAEQLEALPYRGVLSPTEERRVFRKLCDAENVERMLHARFPGTKRFSLEGGETLIPLLDLVMSASARQGVKEIVLGMAHRGRLNTLVNTLEKPLPKLISEFQDARGATQGSGDVKYHLGYGADLVTVHGDHLHVSLTANPSHLEAVNAVVEGRARAKQDRGGDTTRVHTLPLLIHGDAAFSGQGSVMETLNLSELPGYRTGGTIHVVVNNQIGFTTPPHEARSTPYATDIARMLGVPIFHVNGEVPRAVAAVVAMAVEYRQRFHRDVVIDMYCYRKHGHNEGDEPSFTQPTLYELIRSRPTPREVYAKHLVRIGTLTTDECDRIYEESFADLNRAADAPEAPPKDPVVGSATSALRSLWLEHTGGSSNDVVDTTFDRARLVELLRGANTLPSGFEAHAKIRRLLAQRTRMIEGEEPADWALGEQAAWATLLDQGYFVRLSGQDSGRGTFSHRHAVITDTRSGAERYPLDEMGLRGRFTCYDSSLSELAVLGFEVGYAFDSPDGLVLWEAQFGDFANGAQIIIDQYLTTSEQKWNRHCGLVLLLPHGYEGQGPEHSSARLERFLQLCAEDNLQVANCTTPANLFHLLRRQMIRRVRKPLVLMTPKSGLRHPGATSAIDDFAAGRFQRVIGDASALDPAKVRRVVLCSGKVYFDLLARRTQLGLADVALVRVEQLYPLPLDDLRAEIARYSAADVVWCQEEPRNMGAWPSVFPWLHEQWPELPLRYVGRPASASPATGSHKQHVAEQSALVDAALAPGSRRG
jgi:2-oxoglutarate dehydrogenase E1 component